MIIADKANGNQGTVVFKPSAVESVEPYTSEYEKTTILRLNFISGNVIHIYDVDGLMDAITIGAKNCGMINKRRKNQ